MTVSENDLAWLQRAFDQSKASRDPHPSAAILWSDGSATSTHNGLPSDVISYTYRERMPERRMFSCCAEERAIVWHLMNQSRSLERATMYSTQLMCPMCARLASLARLRRAVYAYPATNLSRTEQEASLAILKESGVELVAVEVDENGRPV